MSSLLEKTRKINRLLQRSENVEYDGISRVLSNVLNANVYITNKKGKIFGYAFVDDFECDLMVDNVINQGEFPKHYVNWLMRMDETNANMRSKTGMCAYSENSRCLFNGKNTTVVPIYGVGERIGTLIIAKYDEEFTDDDLLLCEYGATVVGMEMLRDHAQKIEIEARKKATVQIALNTLSFSERKAAQKGVAEGVDGHIAVRVGHETTVAGNLHAAQPHRQSRGEGVHVVPVSSPDIHSLFFAKISKIHYFCRLDKE